MGRGEAGNKTNISMEAWENKLNQVNVAKADLNRLVMNFLVTEMQISPVLGPHAMQGYVEAARAFEAEAGVSPGVDLGGITDRMHIRQAVQSGQVEQAIEQVNDLNPEILETQSGLLFHLHQQQLVELIRGGDVQQALQFAGEYLAPAGQEQPALLEELERTVTLLAFNDPGSSPLSDLLSLAQRHKTASELNAAILQSQAQEREARLPQLLRLFLWAQQQLSERANFPHIKDLSTGQLQSPTAD